MEDEEITSTKDLKEMLLRDVGCFISYQNVQITQLEAKLKAHKKYKADASSFYNELKKICEKETYPKKPKSERG